MNFYIKLGLLLVLGTTPFTLHSTDIYHTSGKTIQVLGSLSPTIIPWDAKLGSTILLIKAPSDKKDIHIVTPCQHRESLLYKKELSLGTTLSVIQVSFGATCDTPDIRVADSEYIFTDTIFPLPITSTKEMENTLINTSSSELLGIMRTEPIPLSDARNLTIAEKLQHVQTLYKNLSTIFKSNLAQRILVDREDAKYISPVAGYSIPEKDVLLPGANRGYRRDTTDGVHHGLDVMAPYGTTVQALSKGKIVRIMNNWGWWDFAKLKRWALSEDDKLQNLDIFRGNQVWLQSMDGNVVFYSHLSKISPNIQVGTSVEKGQYLWNIGTSGVPEKNYKNIHLHFEIQKNPFQTDMKNPNLLDIMRWDYIGDHLGRDKVHDALHTLFQ